MDNKYISDEKKYVFIMVSEKTHFVMSGMRANTTFNKCNAIFIHNAENQGIVSTHGQWGINACWRLCKTTRIHEGATVDEAGSPRLQS